VALAAAILFFLAAFRAQRPPHVTATFTGFSTNNAENLARFSITNASGLLVHLHAYQFGGPPTPRQAETIPPNQATIVSIPLPIPHPTKIHFRFRRRDTSFEEGREMLDSVLRSVGIRIGGLNPDSSANEFQVTATIPPAL
jgi:hypothetical protein